MNVWWCNQRHGWETEFREGVVRSSAVTGNDRFRRTVAEAKRGDIVVHYRQQKVVAFSRAKENGHSEDILPGDYEHGWEFRTEYYALETPLPLWKFQSEVETPAIVGFAFNTVGIPNQGYFYRFSLDGLAAILSHVEDEKLPEWLREIREADEKADGDLELFFREGSRYRKHLRRERNRQLAAEAKRIHGYTCQVCEFDFEQRYGPRGRGYIEAHHIVPLQQLDSEADLRLSPELDFAVVCANCHRMLHREPYLSVDELRASVRR